MATSKSIPAEQFGNKLPLRAKIGYGGIGLSTIANTMLVTWQLFFYTTFAGLDVATAGIIIASADILAAFVAPVWGYISDRLYRTKLGRKIDAGAAPSILTIPVFLFSCSSSSIRACRHGATLSQIFYIGRAMLE